MSKFLDLLERSVITQSFITLLVVTACIVLAVMGQPLPEWLETVLYVIIGFFFGSKSVTALAGLRAYRQDTGVVGGDVNRIDHNAS